MKGLISASSSSVGIFALAYCFASSLMSIANCRRNSAVLCAGSSLCVALHSRIVISIASAATQSKPISGVASCLKSSPIKSSVISITFSLLLFIGIVFMILEFTNILLFLRCELGK